MNPAQLVAMPLACISWLLPAMALAACAPAQDPRPDPAPEARPVAPERDPLHAPWHRILHAHVRNERVDYLAIRARDREALRGYLDAMADVDVAALGRAAQLAYYLNLYNATMVATIVDRYAPGWTVAGKDFAVFQEKLVRLKGSTISLDELEHGIVRKRFGDHRIHVALVCGARSCPPLLPRAYDAADLDQELARKWLALLEDPFRNQVDRAAKVVRLSRIFEWFADDFGGEKGIRKLLSSQFGPEVGSFRIDHLDYSWDLNIVPAKDDR